MTLAPPRIHNLLHHLQSKQKAEGDEASHCDKAKICLNVCLRFVCVASTRNILPLIICLDKLCQL